MTEGPERRHWSKRNVELSFRLINPLCKGVEAPAQGRAALPGPCQIKRKGQQRGI